MQDEKPLKTFELKSNPHENDWNTFEVNSRDLFQSFKQPNYLGKILAHEPFLVKNEVSGALRHLRLLGVNPEEIKRLEDSYFRSSVQRVSGHLLVSADQEQKILRRALKDYEIWIMDVRLKRSRLFLENGRLFYTGTLSTKELDRLEIERSVESENQIRSITRDRITLKPFIASSPAKQEPK